MIDIFERLGIGKKPASESEQQDRRPNRREVLVGALGLMLAASPLLLFRNRFAKSAFQSPLPLQAASQMKTVVCSYLFPESFTHEDFEREIPNWVDCERFTQFLLERIKSGDVLSFAKKPGVGRVDYHIVFASDDASRAYLSDLFRLKIVRADERARRGLRLQYS